MDSSQEAANVAQVKSYHLGRWTVVLATIQIVLTIYSIWPTQTEGGTFILKGWLPTVLLLANSSITAVVLLFFAIKLRQSRRLTREIDSLKADLSEANANSLRLKHELDAKTQAALNALNPPELITAQAEIERIGNQNEQLQVELHLAEKELATLKGDKGRLTREIAKLEKSSETKQRELAEARTDVETKEFQRMGILLEKNMLADKMEQLEGAIKVTSQKLRQEEIQSGNWTRLANEADRKLHEFQWVQDIIDAQSEALQDHVVILRDFKCRVDLIDTSLGPPRIRFGFKIRNEALPNITIHEKGVGGKVYFRDHPLTETCRFDPTFASNVENIEHKAEGGLYLDQKLTAAEIDRISKALESNPNAEFSFEHVLIKVSGGDNFPYEATEPLHIPGDYQRVKLSDCQINSNTENP